MYIALTITGYFLGSIGLWLGCIISNDANGPAVSICGSTIILVTSIHVCTRAIIKAMSRGKESATS